MTPDYLKGGGRGRRRSITLEPSPENEIKRPKFYDPDLNALLLLLCGRAPPKRRTGLTKRLQTLSDHLTLIHLSTHTMAQGRGDEGKMLR